MSFLAIIIIIGAFVVSLGTILEWRSWKKPLAPGFRDWWGGNPNAGGGRPITGGHNFDQRHD
jgi:hypothetical protein